MAKPAVAAGALLGTIVNTANTVSSIVNTVNNSVSMANNYVERQLIKQQDATVIDLSVSRQRLIEDSSLETMRRTETLNKELGRKTDKGACYDKAHATYTALFATEEA
jgi:hypothetical protein